MAVAFFFQESSDANVGAQRVHHLRPAAGMGVRHHLCPHPVRLRIPSGLRIRGLADGVGGLPAARPRSSRVHGHSLQFRIELRGHVSRADARVRAAALWDVRRLQVAQRADIPLREVHGVRDQGQDVEGDRGCDDTQ